MDEPVYLDHHSTTPCDPRVVKAMTPFFTERFGNAASRSHRYGWDAADAVQVARRQVASLIGARTSKEIVFTSGATESDNLALKGALSAYREQRRDHIVVSRIEHKAVIDTCRRLERAGASVTWLEPDAWGRIDPRAVAAALTETTLLVSVMLANNEVGTLQPIEEIGKLTQERGVLLHVDAAQGPGLVPLHVETMSVDLASLSAHKLYGPKGVGALYVRRASPRVKLVAEMDGGGHERGMRSGTLAVPLIVGFGVACELMQNEGTEDAGRMAALRDRLQETLTAELPGVQVNGGEPAQRHPGNLNVSFDGVTSESLMVALKDDVAVSSGSACTSASVESSYVLRAMGVDAARADASIRFGLGRSTTQAQIDRVAHRVVEEVMRLRRC